MTGDGNVYQVTPDEQHQMTAALDAAIAATEDGEHLWFVAAAWRLSPATAERIANGEDAGTLLDRENLASVIPGCFICEQPLTWLTFHSRCPGEQQ